MQYPSYAEDCWCGVEYVKRYASNHDTSTASASTASETSSRSTNASESAAISAAAEEEDDNDSVGSDISEMSDL